jgi:TfoX/Sxy family transcriptional regulator of competence genes
MKHPRLDPAIRALYESALPKDARVQTRAMFGGLGSFVNGNMFCGALGTRIFLRLPAEDLEALLQEAGGGLFEPVKGRAMRDYANIPDAWMRNPAKVRDGMNRALAWVASLPPKSAKKGRASNR